MSNNNDTNASIAPEIDADDEDSKLDEPKASEFGVDDRPEASRRNSDGNDETPGDQAELFPSIPKTDDLDEDQATLGMADTDHCPFESDDDQDESDDRDIQTQTATDEYGNEHIIHYDRNHEHCATIEKHSAKNAEHCEYCDDGQDSDESDDSNSLEATNWEIKTYFEKDGRRLHGNAAKALSREYDTIGEILDAPAGEIKNLEGVGRKAIEQLAGTAVVSNRKPLREYRNDGNQGDDGPLQPDVEELARRMNEVSTIDAMDIARKYIARNGQNFTREQVVDLIRESLEESHHLVASAAETLVETAEESYQVEYKDESNDDGTENTSKAGSMTTDFEEGQRVEHKDGRRGVVTSKTNAAVRVDFDDGGEKLVSPRSFEVVKDSTEFVPIPDAVGSWFDQADSLEGDSTDDENDREAALDLIADAGSWHPDIIGPAFEISPNVATTLYEQADGPSDVMTWHHNLDGDLSEFPGIGEKSAQAIASTIPMLKSRGVTRFGSLTDDSDDGDDLEADQDDAREVATDGGEPATDDNEMELPENETVRLITGITGVMHSPKIIEGETSGTGKTIAVQAPNRDKTKRIDTEPILSGESEYRDSRYYELYTPGRYRKNQRSNHAPGPQAGANQISDPDDLPEPTHWPAIEQPDHLPNECPACGSTDAPYQIERVKNPRCEACSELLEIEDDQDDDTDGDDFEGETEADKWDLSQYGRGDVLTLDAHAGRWVVVNIKSDIYDNVQALDVVNDSNKVLRLRKVDLAGGVRFDAREGSIEGGQFREKGGTSVMVNVDEMDDIQDFEKIGEDEERLREWIRNEYYSDYHDDSDDDDDNGRLMTDGGEETEGDQDDEDDQNAHARRIAEQLEMADDDNDGREIMSDGGRSIEFNGDAETGTDRDELSPAAQELAKLAPILEIVTEATDRYPHDPASAADHAVRRLDVELGRVRPDGKPVSEYFDARQDLNHWIVEQVNDRLKV